MMRRTGSRLAAASVSFEHPLPLWLLRVSITSIPHEIFLRLVSSILEIVPEIRVKYQHRVCNRARIHQPKSCVNSKHCELVSGFLD